MEAIVEIDASKFVEEIEEALDYSEIARQTSENMDLDDLAQKVVEEMSFDPDDYVKAEALGQYLNLSSEAETLLDSMPEDPDSWCSLGRSFSSAVVKVMAMVLDPAVEPRTYHHDDTVREIRQMVGLARTIRDEGRPTEAMTTDQVVGHGSGVVEPTEGMAVSTAWLVTDARWAVQTYADYDRHVPVGLVGPFTTLQGAEKWARYVQSISTGIRGASVLAMTGDRPTFEEYDAVEVIQ